MSHFSQTNKNLILDKCKQSLNDPWSNTGPAVTLPVKIVNDLISALNFCEHTLSAKEHNDIKLETVKNIISILAVHADNILSHPENKLGDNTSKNLAIIEAIKIIKKEYKITENN